MAGGHALGCYSPTKVVLVGFRPGLSAVQEGHGMTVFLSFLVSPSDPAIRECFFVLCEQDLNFTLVREGLFVRAKTASSLCLLEESTVLRDDLQSVDLVVWDTHI